MSKDRDFSGYNRGRGGRKPERENGYQSAGEVRAAKRESYKGGKSSGKHADSHKENHGKRDEFRNDRETASDDDTAKGGCGRRRKHIAATAATATRNRDDAVTVHRYA